MWLHDEANRMLDAWANEDRQSWAKIKRRIANERGKAAANTVDAMARWQIKLYEREQRVFGWRAEWLQQ